MVNTEQKKKKKKDYLVFSLYFPLSVGPTATTQAHSLLAEFHRSYQNAGPFLLFPVHFPNLSKAEMDILFP